LPSQLFFLALLVVLPAALALGGHGFGDNYEWKSLEEAKALAKEQNKPIMLIVHKSWCGACKRLGPAFADAAEIKFLANNFIMVNTVDDEEPKGTEYAPDGGYIPRILFLDPSGAVHPELINEQGNAKYKYYYPEVGQIATAMKTALSKLSSATHADL